MNRVTKLTLLLALGMFIISAAPGVAPTTAAATPASFRVEPSYLLTSSLNYGTGTISTVEKITIRNWSGVSISSINLSVMPRAA